jgi:GT2 family glycosyltransferase
MFSIIIINYKTKELTKNCINSVFFNFSKNNFEIILADNASKDGSVEMLKNDFGEKIKLIANSENKGFGPANNQGAKLAKGEYLFLLNSDTIIKNNILLELEKFLIKNKDVGIVAPKLFLKDGSEQPFAFGDYPRLLSLIFEKFKKPPKYLNGPFEVEWVSGAALIIRRELFKQLGGFDEKFFMYFEDIDLCKRVKEMNYKIFVNPKISLTHLCGKSPARFVKRKSYYYESQDYFYKKHYGSLIMYLMKIIRWPYKIFVLLFGK